MTRPLQLSAQGSENDGITTEYHNKQFQLPFPLHAGSILDSYAATTAADGASAGARVGSARAKNAAAAITAQDESGGSDKSNVSDEYEFPLDESINLDKLTVQLLDADGETRRTLTAQSKRGPTQEQIQQQKILKQVQEQTATFNAEKRRQMQVK